MSSGEEETHDSRPETAPKPKETWAEYMKRMQKFNRIPPPVISDTQEAEE